MFRCLYFFQKSSTHEKILYFQVANVSIAFLRRHHEESQDLRRLDDNARHVRQENRKALGEIVMFFEVNGQATQLNAGNLPAHMKTINAGINKKLGASLFILNSKNFWTRTRQKEIRVDAFNVHRFPIFINKVANKVNRIFKS